MSWTDDFWGDMGDGLPTNGNSGNQGSNSSGSNGSGPQTMDEWFELINRIVGTVVAGVGMVKQVVEGTDGNLYYETDNGLVPVQSVVGPSPQNRGLDPMLLLVLVVLLTR